MREWKKASGIEYYFFGLRFLIGALIFLVWSINSNLFLNTGWVLFYAIFFIAVFSGILARIIAYVIIYAISRKAKSTIPSPYQLNFKSGINRFSLVYVLGTVISALIYAFAIDDLIMNYLFPEPTLFSMFLVYIIIKIVAKSISWLFFKIS